jgi:NAD(P)-dependent dehydrogenase (short-subunit alcohol dehydrogenase family)
MTQTLYNLARASGHEALIGQLDPLKRGGAPIEVARAIAFLACDDASYTSGQALIVDGGLSSSLPFSRPRKLGQPSF